MTISADDGKIAHVTDKCDIRDVFIQRFGKEKLWKIKKESMYASRF